MYHPDLLVNTERGEILVEVKSLYTAGLCDHESQKEMFRVMHRKLKVSKEQGYEIKLAVVEKGKVHIVHKPYTKTFKQIRAEAKALLLE